MARFILSALQLTTSNLRRIAVVLKAEVAEASNYRRIRRFLKDYSVDYTAVSRLLYDLIPQDPPYVLVLDRTEWHFGSTPVNVLMIGIAHRGVAFPIAWTVFSHGGGSGHTEHIAVLQKGLQVVDAEEVEALVADREFISTAWLRRLQAENIPFAIRLRSNRRVFTGENDSENDSENGATKGPSLPVKMYARGLSKGGLSKGETRILGTRQLQGNGDLIVEVQIVLRRIGARNKPLKDQFLVLATSGLDPCRGPRLYKQRWEVETLFAALKSRGFDLEATHVTKPSRIRRLIALLALCTVGAGLCVEPPCWREAGVGRRPSRNEGARATGPQSLSVRTRPTAGHHRGLRKAASGVRGLSACITNALRIFVRYLEESQSSAKKPPGIPITY
jgi:hypothetical protein